MSTRSIGDEKKGQPHCDAAGCEGTHRHGREVSREPAAADQGADGDLAYRIAGDSGEDSRYRLFSTEIARRQVQHRDGDRVDVGKPDDDSARNRAGCAECFRHRATEHDNRAEETANPTTEKRSNGLRNPPLRSLSPVFPAAIQATTKPSAASTAARSTGRPARGVQA